MTRKQRRKFFTFIGIKPFVSKGTKKEFRLENALELIARNDLMRQIVDCKYLLDRINKRPPENLFNVVKFLSIVSDLLVNVVPKKKKDRSTLCVRYSTDDVIKSLGLAPNSSSEIIQDKLSSYLGHLVVFHTFSFLDISKKKNNRISSEKSD